MPTNLIKKAKALYSATFIQKNLKLISSSAPYLFFLQKIIAHQAPKDQFGPYNLIIETSSFCNAHCLMCPHPTMKRKQGLMTKKVFQKILDRLVKEKPAINKIILSGFGEPLLDSDFLSRLEKIKALGYPIRFYTNASLLTKKIAKKLIDLQVEEINISFNGTNPTQYQKIMGLNYQKTVQNINYLLKLRKHQNSPFPQIQISSIIIKENEKSIQKHLSTWQKKADSATVSLAHEWGGAIKLKSQKKFQKTPQTYPCRSLWHTLLIDSAGNFVICCRDYESRFKLGHITTHSFKKAAHHPTRLTWQKLHLKYQKAKLPPICQNCNFPYQDGLEWLLPRSID
jgi:radical SAM protein with 4Fe4S-binding SPASM domain